MLNLLLKRRVRRLVQKAEQLLLDDDIQHGHPLAEEAYQLSRDGLAPESAEYVLSAFIAGSARISANDLGGAERALADAAHNANSSLADDPMRTAAILNNLAIVYSRTKRPKQSIPLMKRAIEIKRILYGQGDARYIGNLQDLVAAFEAAGEPGNAEPYVREMAGMIEEYAGPESADYVRALQNLALACRHNGKHAEAEEIMERATAIQESHEEDFESDSRMDLLVDEAKQKYASGDFEAARRIHQRIIDRLPDLSGLMGNLPDVMGNMFDPLAKYSEEVEQSGLAAEQEGRFSAAASAYRQRVEMFRVMLPDQHPWIAFAMSNEAEALRKAKRLDEAKPIILEALSRISGADVPEREHLLRNVVNLYMDICDEKAPDPGDNYSEAISSMQDKPAEYTRSMRIRFPIPSAKDTPIQTALKLIDARAHFYESVGDRVRTQFLLETAAELASTVEPESAGYPMEKLADFYLQHGMMHEVARLREMIRDLTPEGERSVKQTIAEMLHRAQVLSQSADHVAAEKVMIAALELTRGTYGSQSDQSLEMEHNLIVVRQRIGGRELKEDIARIVARYQDAGVADAERLQRLANYHMELGEYSQAEECFKKSLAIQEEKEGEWNPHYALTLSNLGTLYRFMGRFGEAESAYRKAVQIRRVELGSHHPSLINALVRLAIAQAAVSKYAEACKTLHEVMEASDQWLSRVSSIASNAARLNLVREQTGQVDLLLSIHRASADVSSARHAFEWVLKRKALSLAALSGMRAAVLGGRYPKLQRELAELDELNSELTRNALEHPGEEPDEDALAAKEDIERKLARSIPEMQMERVMAGATVESVCEALPTGSVLVEFLEYSPYNFSWARAQGGVEQLPPRYMAFVLRAGAPDSLQSVDLGESDALAGQIREFVKQAAVSTDDRASIDRSSTRSPASTLATSLLEPLGPLLGDAERLLLAPDGQLCVLPFELLQFENGQLLFERCEVSYIGTARDALRFQSLESRDMTSPAIFADPDFDLVDSGEDPADLTETDDLRAHFMQGFDLGSCPFGRLEGTRTEAERISAILPKAQVYLGPAALESRIRVLRSPAVLHLATHGFFLPGEKEKGKVDLREAMYASGLAFAGANSFLARRPLPEEAEDGILTAEDVATLNLLDTELVVLSACNTALGTPVRGEGVFGLRRAFFVAGARTVVMSLWPVPDAETVELMAAFYSFVVAGMPKPTALRKAKQTLRDTGAPVSAWAPFICEGDWRPCRTHSLSS